MNEKYQIASDIGKAQLFVHYVESKLPGITGLAGFGADINQQIKKITQDNGGVCPYQQIYETVRQRF
jgi:hypothetical protein